MATTTSSRIGTDSCLCCVAVRSVSTKSSGIFIVYTRKRFLALMYLVQRGLLSNVMASVLIVSVVACIQLRQTYSLKTADLSSLP